MPPKFVRNLGASDVAGSRPAELVSLLNSGDSDDEDFFLKGPRMGEKIADPKIGKLQNQVGEVIDIMKDNVSRVMDRGCKLEDLQDRSDDLVTNSDLFRSRAVNLRQRMWWQNCWTKIIIGMVILIVLAVIIIPIIIQNS
ncbi:vesicle-associated membrane protein 4-like [Octopus vulgaris]|uniref:Vesicle-associated membrane protein 4-like n=2 Tax=Octopus TaxID=6643 RepID=A0AA36FDQ4_OCTVU|nr:vesicle-associated membrane protein 4 [Octopus sinensis]CAI9730928.1 vesicle-associated membrane protein 4-like [Octopus vulgaris]